MTPAGARRETVTSAAMAARTRDGRVVTAAAIAVVLRLARAMGKIENYCQ
jgi:hypothetical protein